MSVTTLRAEDAVTNNPKGNVMSEKLSDEDIEWYADHTPNNAHLGMMAREIKERRASSSALLDDVAPPELRALASAILRHWRIPYDDDVLDRYQCAFCGNEIGCLQDHLHDCAVIMAERYK